MSQSHQFQNSKKKRAHKKMMPADSSNSADNPDKALAIHIGKRLRELRLFQDITQTQLGEKLGVTFQQVQKYERGTNNINVSKLLDCAMALNVNINYFFEEFAKYEKHQGLDRQPRNTSLTMGDTHSTDQLYHIVGILSRIKNPAVMTALLRLAKSLSADGSEP